VLKVETNQFRLQYITHCNERFSYIEGAEMALEGGCRWIQLRMKKSSRDEILSVARHLKQKCKEKDLQEDLLI
jgi:thiamine-phosphate pyrophosphorylase